MSSKERKQNLRVGVFVAMALAVLAVTVFVIGQERSMFTRKTRLYTSFKDINGLVIGAPVRLAGVDVGRVTGIEFSEDLSRPDARVELAVEDKYMDRVRRDTHAFIDSKGLLGDKLINLSVGSQKQPALQSGDYVQPKSGLSFEAMAQELESTASSIGRAAQSAQTAVEGIATPEVTENLRRITGSLAAILEQVERGDSVAHHLFYDPQYAQRASNILAQLEKTSVNASHASGRIDRVLARVEQGPGTLHSLAYGEEGTQMLADLRRASAGIAELTEQINHGDGLATAILRDEQGKKLVRDLSAFTARLDRISSEVEKGRGTLGGLIVDPSVYEEMKTVLGNIERNVVFKALVRMTIKEEGIARPPAQARPARVQD